MMGSEAIDGTIRKYGLPIWIKPYVYEYVKRDPVKAIKYAASFIEVGRKKGAITKKAIRLPNGHVFQKDEIMRILDLFYYGEERISRMSERWANESGNPDWEYTRHFREVAGVEARHARAIKNVMEGLGHKIEKPPKQFVEVFDFVENLTDCQERLITKRIVFWYSYRVSFGMVFYKVFYPVAPEFLRSLAKTFNMDRAKEELLGDSEVERIIKSNQINSDRLMWLVRQTLARIYNSIQAEKGLAKKAKVEREVQFLADIAIASPLHKLREMGVELDVRDELKGIKRLSQQILVKSAANQANAL